MENFSVDTLKPGLSFTNDILLDNSFVILPKSVEISDSIIKILKEWNISKIFCNGNISLKEKDDSEKQKTEIPKEKATIGQNIKKIVETAAAEKTDDSDNARLIMVKKVYDEYLNYIEQVFTRYSTHKEIDKDDLTQTVQNLCIFVKEHHRYVLRVNNTHYNPDKNFLVTHALKTTVLSIALAQQLHVPLSKMIELGIACVIHEIGMLKLPPQLYMTNKKLNAAEKTQISKHPIFGYSIAKELDFSLPVQLGVLEHQERSNGTGYPRRLTGNAISSIARIIAVTCAYEAIISPRPYKNEKNAFNALLELIQNKENQYDSNVLKALLLTVSLFPIGTYVYLSNKKIAEVIDGNKENPKYPVVQLLTEKEADGTFKIIQTKPNEISVLRILTKSEEEDILNLLNEKKKLLEEAQKEAETQNAAKVSQTKNISAENARQIPKQNDDPTAKPETRGAENKEKIAIPTQNDQNPNDKNKIEEVDINFFD